MSRDVFTRAQAAEYLGVSLDAFDEHVRPHLPRVLIGARVRFLRADLDAWVASRREAPSAVQQSRSLSSAAESGTSASRSGGAGFEAQRASQIADELSPISPRAGMRNTRRRTSLLRLVQE